MPVPSDSSTAGRRNIFDSPAPAFAAAESAGQPSRSIFDGPAPVSTRAEIGSEGGLPFPCPRIPRPRAVGWLAIAALASSAAAVLGLMMASHGDSRATGAQRTLPALDPPKPAVRRSAPSHMGGPKSGDPRAATGRRPRRQDQRRRNRHRRSHPAPVAPRVAPTPPTATPEPTPPPVETSPLAPVAPAPARPAPAPVPAGAPPQFL